MKAGKEIVEDKDEEHQETWDTVKICEIVS